MRENKHKLFPSRIFSISLWFMVCCLTNAACVQKDTSRGYAIKLQLPDAWTTGTLFLYSYNGEKTQKIDSLFVGVDKRATFKGEQALQAGMYVINAPHFPLGIDFFISDGQPQQFEIACASQEGPSLEQIPSLTVSGSPENKAFADYMKYSVAKHREKVRLEELRKNKAISPDSTATIHRRINGLVQEVKAYNIALEKEYRGSTFALFLKMIQEVDVPDLPSTASMSDLLRQEHFYNFYKEHYFDSIDFSDERILRMPVLDQKLDMYFARLLPPNPKVINEYVDKVLKMARANRTVYEFTVRNLYELFRESSFPELYLAAIHIGDTYVLKESAEWNDKEFVAKMAVAIRAAKLNPVGEKATDLFLQTPAGKNISIYDVQSPYTLLYFYDSDCPSCKVIGPEVFKLFQKYKHKGLAVYAVYIEGVKESWEKYITENKWDWVGVWGAHDHTGEEGTYLHSRQWINVWDEHSNQGIYDKYDIHAIPMMLLLDKNKVVLAKDFLPDTLEYMLEQMKAVN